MENFYFKLSLQKPTGKVLVKSKLLDIAYEQEGTFYEYADLSSSTSDVPIG